MTRKALIIGAAYGDKNIPGVYTDVDAWTYFLRSTIGGAWFPDEIVSLKDPTLDEVVKALNEVGKSEYGFVVFCGHGELLKTDKPWRETVAYLGEQGRLTESQLNPGTPWCTLLFDCCRYAGEFSAEEMLLENDKMASFKSIFSVRQRFEDELRATEKGLVRIFAASVGQGADDEKSFSKQLIHEATLNMKTHSGILNQEAAVELASEAMRITLPQQNPQYLGGRRLHHFPFALNV